MGVYRHCPNFFEYPLLSQERVKLRTSTFVRTFLVIDRNKSLLQISEKVAGVEGVGGKRKEDGRKEGEGFSVPILPGSATDTETYRNDVTVLLCVSLHVC